MKTRQPTGLPSWPILLLAGAEKTGKSYACALASGSELIDRTFWVGVGEDAPDEYGAVPGARFEIVEHDGTYRQILTALTEATQVQPAEGKQNLVVLDSAGRLWDLLSDMGQEEANQRARSKAARYNRPAPQEEARIDMDLWNVAKSRWQHVLDCLRAHRGPSIVTARLEISTVMDAEGRPTKDKTHKIKAEKGLPFDVGAIVEMPERGKAYLTGVRSVRLADKSHARTELRNFTVDGLWKMLGLEETSPRDFAAQSGATSVAAEDNIASERQRLLAKLSEFSVNKQQVAGEWMRNHGHPIGETTDLDSLAALVAMHEVASQ